MAVLILQNSSVWNAFRKSLIFAQTVVWSHMDKTFVSSHTLTFWEKSHRHIVDGGWKAHISNCNFALSIVTTAGIKKSYCNSGSYQVFQKTLARLRRIPSVNILSRCIDASVQSQHRFVKNCRKLFLRELVRSEWEYDEAERKRFCRKREQFGQKEKLRKLKTNNERENETHYDSELCVKHDHRTSTERLSIEGTDGGAYCIRLWENGRLVILARASLECPKNRRSRTCECAMEIRTCRFTIGEQAGKASLDAVFGRHNGRKGSTRADSHLGRQCSMRLVDGARQILRLGSGSRVGRKLFGWLKYVVIPSSVKVLCKLSGR
jgi:hypothetical protein